MSGAPSIAIVTRPTRLAGLVARWATASAARFRLRLAHEHEAERRAPASPAAAATVAAAQAAAEFDEYQEEHQAYESALDQLKASLNIGFPLTVVDQSFLPNFDFSRCVLVVVLGQDGLVANTAKYVGDLPIVAVNPDPRRFDGILLPFQVREARQAVQAVLRAEASLRPVTLAEVRLNDGQRLLAFNDFFVGVNSHTSARYLLAVGGQSEPQSSSGILVSTGAGSTGWLSSVCNMAHGFAAWMGSTVPERVVLPWESPALAWVVREPFRSKQSSVNLVAGFLQPGEELVIESLMPTRGVIFSDGIESDFLEFNSGTIARIFKSDQTAKLVVT